MGHYIIVFCQYVFIVPLYHKAQSYFILNVGLLYVVYLMALPGTGVIAIAIMSEKHTHAHARAPWEYNY